MDPIVNQFSPGAGAPPPELVGRDQVRETARIAIEHTRIGKPLFDEFMKRIMLGADWLTA